MATFDWKLLGKDLKKSLPSSSLQVATEGRSVAVFLHSSIAAIIIHLPKTEELPESLCISLRASCPPIESGIISVVCSNFRNIEYDEYFEIDYASRKLYGHEALRFAWAHGSDFVEPSDDDTFMTTQILQPN
jgi:hypothetical protein